MLFCPKCGSILIPDKQNPSKIRCSCGYKSKQKNLTIKEKGENTSKIEVVDKTIEVLPKTNMQCPKCKHKKAYYWLAQTRAADEAETQFFRCVKCSHQWRAY